MNYLKSIGSILVFSFLTGCFGPPQANNNPRQVVNRDDAYYDRRRETDPDRRAVLDRTRTKYSGRACEDEDRDHECKEQCRDIYSRRGDRDDCEELPVAQIDRLEKLHDLLEDPDKDDLEDDVDHDDVDVYLNVSIAPLDRHIGRYSSREAKEFLLWMIDNPDIAKVFEKEDDDYEALDTLLKRVEGFSGNDHHVPFIEKVDGSDRLMEVAIASGNEEVIEWFQEYIHQHNSDCDDDETSSNCFAVYCKIGDGIDDDSADDWLSFETFEDYINDIIDEETNGTAWSPSSKRPGGADPYEDSRDLDEDWVDALCSGLT